MIDNFDGNSFRLFLAASIEKEDVTVRQVAKAIGCSEATLLRILAAQTVPTDGLMKQGGIMFAVGFKRYNTLSTAEKEMLSESIGTASAGAFGFAAITAAISSLGIPGLAAPGIATGLASLGSIVGGGMLAGVSVAAAIPLATGAMGYGIIKGIKYLISERQVSKKEIDPRWEKLPPDDDGPGEEGPKINGPDDGPPQLGEAAKRESTRIGELKNGGDPGSGRTVR